MIGDPVTFWTRMRDHHDRKASDGLTDAPDLHAELAWNAERHLSAIEREQARLSPSQRNKGP